MADEEAGASIATLRIDHSSQAARVPLTALATRLAADTPDVWRAGPSTGSGGRLRRATARLPERYSSMPWVRPQSFFSRPHGQPSPDVVETARTADIAHFHWAAAFAARFARSG